MYYNIDFFDAAFYSSTKRLKARALQSEKMKTFAAKQGIDFNENTSTRQIISILNHMTRVLSHDMTNLTLSIKLSQDRKDKLNQAIKQVNDKYYKSKLDVDCERWVSTGDIIDEINDEKTLVRIDRTEAVKENFFDDDYDDTIKITFSNTFHFKQDFSPNKKEWLENTLDLLADIVDEGTVTIIGEKCTTRQGYEIANGEVIERDVQFTLK